MKYTILILFTILSTFLNASITKFQLNFLIDPSFEINQEYPDSTISQINEILINFDNKTNQNSVNILAGKISTLTPSPKTDSLVVKFLNGIKCQLAVPTDYLFHTIRDINNFELLATNIFTDKTNPHVISEKIYSFEDKRIGILAIYSPDSAVKLSYSEEVNFKFELFDFVENKVQEMQKKTDFIIMLSSLSRYIDNHITRNAKVDILVSFDYQKARSGKLSNGVTNFYSFHSHSNEIGVLQFYINEENFNLEYSFNIKKMPSNSEDERDINNLQ